MKKLIIFSVFTTLALSQLVSNPCANAPYNCPDCTQYQNQCFQQNCLEKIARIGSPIAGVGTLDLALNGKISYVTDVDGAKKLQVQIDYTDSETDPFERNTDGSKTTCISSVLFRLDNNYKLPYNKIENVAFDRSFLSGNNKRLYTFYLTPDQINNLIRLPSDPAQISYQGFYLMEFQVAGVPQARYFFNYKATFASDMTDVLSTNFQAVKEYDTLTCPSNALDDTQCVTNVQSELTFCTDFSFACTTESITSPQLFINMDLYIAHKITSPGFQNWQLHLDQVQFYNIGAGYFQPLTSGEFEYNPGKTVYKVKVSYVQNGVTIGVNSKLVPPGGRRLRRMLQEGNSTKTSSASSQEIECVKEKESDICPMPQSVIDKYSDKSVQADPASDDTSDDKEDAGSNGCMLIAIVALLLTLI